MKRLFISRLVTGGVIISLIVMISVTALAGPLTSAQSAGDNFNPGQSFLEVELEPSGMDILDAKIVLADSPSEAAADRMVYLPLVTKNIVIIPETPVLNAISNGDGDGNFTVSWSSAEGADTYTLHEDDNADFSTPTTVYAGPNSSTAISGKDAGMYYYRVRGSNVYASGDWSNTRSVVVTAPLPDCPRTGLWSGTTSQGYPISFAVETSPRCQIEYGSLSIRHWDNCGIRTYVYRISIPITNNSFTAGSIGNGVQGTFSSSTTADGTFAFEYPDPSGDWCNSFGTWTAPTNMPNGRVYALAVQTDGKILVGGEFTMLGGQPRDRIARLNPDGTLDAAFNPEANGSVRVLAVQADGKIVVGGNFTTLGGQTRERIGRLNSDGTLDAAFNPGANNYVFALAVQADGKIVAGGSFSELGGQSRDNIARLNADGSLDTAFNPGANSMVRTLALQADGKIVVGGQFSELGGQPRDIIGRLNTDGTVDAAFNPGGGLGWVSTLAVQADGKIVAGGSGMVFDGQARSKIGRLNPDGTLDAAFNPGADWEVHSLAVQADGKIVVGGSFSELGGQERQRIGRLNPNGTLDAAFNPGANNIVFELVMQADDKILVGGWFTWLGGQHRTYFGRLNADGTLDTSFP